ncbi:MAG: DUF2807 domain-containing protein [Desulfuromonadaceae bacterium]
MRTNIANRYRPCFKHLLVLVSFFSVFSVATASCMGATNVVNISNTGNVTNVGNVSIDGNVIVSTGCVQGNGKLDTEKREVADFTGLKVDGAFEVTVVCQKKPSLTLSAEGNLLPENVTQVSHGILHITTRKSVCASLPLTVELTMETLERISSGGANDFTVRDVETSSLELNVSGSGDMTVSGQVENLDIALEGASEIHADALKAEQVNVTIGGAGSAEVYEHHRVG